MSPLLIGWLFVINLATAAAYAYDKLAAPRERRRVNGHLAQPVRTTTMIASQATVAIDWTIQNDCLRVLWRIPKNTIHAPTKPPARQSSQSVRSRMRRPPRVLRHSDPS